MKDKKIVFLINSLTFGGAERVLSILANELSKKYKVDIIFLEKNEFYTLNKNINKIYLSNFTGKESSLKKLLYIPILAIRLKRYIKQNNIKLIQSHIYRSNYINILAKLFGGHQITQLVTAGRVSRYQELGIIGKINLFLIKYLYKKADLLISKSKGMKEDIQNLFHFKNKHIIINNPYDIKKIEELTKEEVSDFDFNKEKKYIISVGRLIKLKRNHELIEILVDLKNNINLIFLGEGEEKFNLLNLAKKLNVENRVFFLGNVKNPFKYISRSDIFVSCSESEGFPNVLVEAMICETPVISSDCISGPREILGDNKYGLLFDVGDKNKLKEHIMFLFLNEDYKNVMVKNAKKRSYDFSIENIIKQYEKVLINENSN